MLAYTYRSWTRAGLLLAGLMTLVGCGDVGRVTCLLCIPPVENPTCETLRLGHLGIDWGINGFRAEMLEPAPPTSDRTARLAVGQALNLRLSGGNVYNLNCEYQLASVTWVSTHQDVARFDVESRTVASLRALSPGETEVYAGVVLVDGRSTVARGYVIGEGTVATVRVVP